MTDQQTINSVLWRACDTFRGKINSDQYKDYILVMLFVKYLSDVYKDHYSEYLDRYHGDTVRVERAMQRERFILDEKCTFDFLYANRTEDNIGELINTALEKIEEENREKLEGVFRSIDFNSEAVLSNTDERNSMLRALIEDFAIPELDLRPGKIGKQDVIGNAYEFLIAMFASDAGKKGGEFFTPSEVSEMIARLVKPQSGDRIYDPTCGSGSLLIKAATQVGSRNFQLYGQERNGSTQALCKMNMFLHGMDDARIKWGDTLANPLHLENDKLMKFDVVVANPPFSLDKWAQGFANQGDRDFKPTATMDKYKRFGLGVPPKGTGDYAFVQHMLASLNETGRMGIVLPHGVLFRGAAEGKIRQGILAANWLDAVIGLPANLFYGTSIPAVVLVFKKTRNRQDVLFIDASKEFEKEKTQNRLKNLAKIVSAYEAYQEIEKFAHLASPEEIRNNDFNLNISRYVDTLEEEEAIDLEAVQAEIKQTESELAQVRGKLDGYLKELGLG